MLFSSPTNAGQVPADLDLWLDFYIEPEKVDSAQNVWIGSGWERMEDRIRKLEEQLAKAERALERSERLAVASQYASAMMHEVNNPLEAITNLVYLTKIQTEKPELVLENMMVIEDQLTTLGRVTSQALAFHRDEKVAKETDLVKVAESALQLHSEKLARHRIEVNRRFRGPALSNVFASEILQVLSNLILNAADVLQDGAGMINVRVKPCHQFVQITVSDNGPGIPDSFAARLFEPYVTSKSSGTGLGLWLSRRIVERHGGTLRFRTSIESTKTGTSFRICLPRAHSGV